MNIQMFRRHLSNWTTVMVAINSAVNFLVYCLFSAKFRSDLVSTLRCAVSRPRRSPINSDRFLVYSFGRRSRQHRPILSDEIGPNTGEQQQHQPGGVRRRNSLSVMACASCVGSVRAGDNDASTVANREEVSVSRLTTTTV